MVGVLLFVASWDVVGLLFGDRLYSSGSYDVLRHLAGSVSIAGHYPGMRIYGGGLALLTASLTWALLAQRRRRNTVSWRLRLALSALAAWWTSWCVGIALSFFANGQVYAWGSLGKLLGISAVAVMAARVPPVADPGPDRSTGG